MKKPQSPPHIRPMLLSAASRLCVLLALLAAGLLSSCADDTIADSGSGTLPEPSPADDTEMYISVSVPRGYAGSGSAADKENRIETLDVLVFRNGVGSAVGSYFAYAACRGELTDNGKTFQVNMPVGEHFIIHVFANCHDALVAKGFYNSKGREMNTLLGELVTGVNVNGNADATTASATSPAAPPRAGSTTTLPMHGYISDVSIRESDVNRSLTVPVLRSVASVQMVNEAADASGNKNFALRELYVYFYPDIACVAAATTSYEVLAAGEADETRNVTTVSLCKEHSVADTRQNNTDYPDNPRPYSLISPTEVDELGSLYFYENKPWSDTGFDQPDTDTPAATTRLVVGGVYGTDKNADGTPRVTYYRIDFAAADGTLKEILRNHQYIFKIKTVGGSGYDTPDDAALGVPVNMYIDMIDWVNEVEHVDFDMQNYFRSETKSVVLSRDAGSVQSIVVESDVDVSKWQMSFATENNGVAQLSANGNTLSNNRYKVEKAADGKSLTFTSLKTYGNVTGSETLDETLILKVRNLNITYRITQADRSPDDWGDGGNSNADLAVKGIEIAGLDFVVAPGNLIALSDDRGGYMYTFTPTQGYFSGSITGGDYFKWNSLLPGNQGSNQYSSWDPAKDPCRKVSGGKWYTPSSNQLQQLLNAGYVYSTHSGRSGYYFATNGATPVDGNRDQYVFLPSCGYDGTMNLTDGYYWSSTSSGSQTANFLNLAPNYKRYINSGGGKYSSLSVRCVANKSDF